MEIRGKSAGQILLPKHVGIIMDGNGRWAKKRNMPRSYGHKVGAENFKRITTYAAKIGIQHLTMYAFSTENWQRPRAEISALFRLFRQYLQDALQNFLEENIKVIFLGDTTLFPQELQKLIDDVVQVSKCKTGMVLNLAMNYGGRAEITRAVRSIAELVEQGELKKEQITDDLIERHLYTKGQPDPDLIIRPSGEQRLSNFLTWQSAYAELVFLNLLWPDFTCEDLDRALMIFSERQRRFGGV